VTAGSDDGAGSGDAPGTGTAGPPGGGVDVGSVVDALLYAPLGLALEGRSLLPRLVERGRNHIAMARMVGEFAVRKGAEDLAAGAVDAQERLLGLVGLGSTAPGPAESRSSQDVSTPGVTQSPPTAARVAPEAAAAAADIDPGDLPIPGYDLLSASQVVPRLESLTADELELVGRYEAGTRGRRTILAKVAQLRSGSAS